MSKTLSKMDSDEVTGALNTLCEMRDAMLRAVSEAGKTPTGARAYPNSRRVRGPSQAHPGPRHRDRGHSRGPLDGQPRARYPCHYVLDVVRRLVSVGGRQPSAVHG
jgi:hypothetical protein